VTSLARHRSVFGRKYHRRRYSLGLQGPRRGPLSQSHHDHHVDSECSKSVSTIDSASDASDSDSDSDSDSHHYHTPGPIAVSTSDSGPGPRTISMDGRTSQGHLTVDAMKHFPYPLAQPNPSSSSSSSFIPKTVTTASASLKSPQVSAAATAAAASAALLSPAARFAASTTQPPSSHSIFETPMRQPIHSSTSQQHHQLLASSQMLSPMVLTQAALLSPDKFTDGHNLYSPATAATQSPQHGRQHLLSQWQPTSELLPPQQSPSSAAMSLSSVTDAFGSKKRKWNSSSRLLHNVMTEKRVRLEQSAAVQAVAESAPSTLLHSPAPEVLQYSPCPSTASEFSNIANPGLHLMIDCISELPSGLVKVPMVILPTLNVDPVANIDWSRLSDIKTKQFVKFDMCTIASDLHRAAQALCTAGTDHTVLTRLTPQSTIQHQLLVMKLIQMATAEVTLAPQSTHFVRSAPLGTASTTSLLKSEEQQSTGTTVRHMQACDTLGAYMRIAARSQEQAIHQLGFTAYTIPSLVHSALSIARLRAFAMQTCLHTVCGIRSAVIRGQIKISSSTSPLQLSTHYWLEVYGVQSRIRSWILEPLVPAFGTGSNIAHQGVIHLKSAQANQYCVIDPEADSSYTHAKSVARSDVSLTRANASRVLFGVADDATFGNGSGMSSVLDDAAAVAAVAGAADASDASDDERISHENNDGKAVDILSSVESTAIQKNTGVSHATELPYHAAIIRSFVECLRYVEPIPDEDEDSGDGAASLLSLTLGSGVTPSASLCKLYTKYCSRSSTHDGALLQLASARVAIASHLCRVSQPRSTNRMPQPPEFISRRHWRIFFNQARLQDAHPVLSMFAPSARIVRDQYRALRRFLDDLTRLTFFSTRQFAARHTERADHSWFEPYLQTKITSRVKPATAYSREHFRPNSRHWTGNDVLRRFAEYAATLMENGKCVFPESKHEFVLSRNALKRTEAAPDADGVRFAMHRVESVVERDIRLHSIDALETTQLITLPDSQTRVADFCTIKLHTRLKYYRFFYVCITGTSYNRYVARVFGLFRRKRPEASRYNQAALLREAMETQDIEDISLWLAYSGFAFDATLSDSELHEVYSSAQRSAQKFKRGMFEFHNVKQYEMPWDHRRKHAHDRSQMN
jgi:endonuclease YncB( thermonuclease family)